MEQKPIQFNQSVQYVCSIREFWHYKISWGRENSKWNSTKSQEIFYKYCWQVVSTSWCGASFSLPVLKPLKTFTRTSRDAKMKTHRHVLIISGLRSEYWRAICIRKLYNSSPLGRGQTLWWWVTVGTTQHHVMNPADCTYVGSQWSGREKVKSSVLFMLYFMHLMHLLTVLPVQ